MTHFRVSTIPLSVLVIDHWPDNIRDRFFVDFTGRHHSRSYDIIYFLLSYEFRVEGAVVHSSHFWFFGSRAHVIHKLLLVLLLELAHLRALFRD